MKPGKKISTLLLLINFTMIFSSLVHAWERPPRHVSPPSCDTPAVGAPLDGGLLALLAGAGIVYFAARKKKKNQE